MKAQTRQNVYNLSFSFKALKIFRRQKKCEMNRINFKRDPEEKKCLFENYTKRLMFFWIEYFKVIAHAEFVFHCFILDCVFICLYIKSNRYSVVSIVLLIIWICSDLFFFRLRLRNKTNTHPSTPTKIFSSIFSSLNLNITKII